jgi:hypothetical protein
MRAANALDTVELTLANPIGLAPWPLSRLDRYVQLRKMSQQSDCDGIPVLHPQFRLIPKTGGDSNPWA